MKNQFLFVVLFLFSICLHGQTTISSSVSFAQTDVDNDSWPIHINGGNLSNPVIVTLSENISLSQNSQYFIIESEYVTFNGNNKTVTMDNVWDYPGLFQNGDGYLNQYGNAAINNVRVHSDNSSLLNEGGWIGQTYFGYGVSNVIINNCYSDGYTTNYGGGITGDFSSCTVTNSHSSGPVDYYAGGIFGCFSTGTAVNCYSTGYQINYSGGIFGSESSGNASDCYSTGVIGDYSGGIIGPYSTGMAVNCYSTGDIIAHGG